MATKELAQQGGFWGSVDPEVKDKIVIGASLFLFTGVSIYVIKRFYQKQRSRQILKQALYDGTLASIVEKINVALVGAGTDEEKVYEAFSDIPTQEKAGSVAQMYKAAYGETLDEALRGDLGTDELQTVKNIISAKPRNKASAPNYNLMEDWIRRLKESEGTFSTDEDGIYRVLWEVPDVKGYAELSRAITAKTEIGYKDLTDYLNGQLGSDELDHARYIMNRKK